MTRLTMGEAAKAGWGSRASLYRLARSGKLSTTVDGDRQLVDVAELVRVLGEPRAQRKREAEDLVVAPDRDARIELERRVAELEAAKAAIAAELRAERTAARDAATAAAADRARLIELAETAQRQAGEAQKLLADARATAARSWWQKLLLGRPAVLGVVALLLAAAGDARAQYSMSTGNAALQPCLAHLMDAPSDIYRQGVCMGTVGALVFFSQDLFPVYRFCPPDAANYGQALRVVVAYMQRNPGRLHLDFQLLVIEALREAWPCRR
jgi:hypothetical protein